jgi:protein TonB
MSLTKFPDRPPQTRGPSDFHWPPTAEEIDLVEIIDLGSREPWSSAGFVALVGSAAEPSARRLRAVPFPRTPRRKTKPARRRLWPLVVGLLSLELVESRYIPRSDQLPLASPPAEAVAHASSSRVEPTEAPPAAQVEAPRDRVSRPARSPRRDRRAPAATPRRDVRAAPTRRPDVAAPLALDAGAIDEGFKPPMNDGDKPSIDDSFTPPRVAMRPPTAPRPTPFPAARHSRTRVEVTVDALGRVESARLRSTGASYFDAHALQAVKGWRFEPARRGGRPVRAAIDVEVDSP